MAADRRAVISESARDWAKYVLGLVRRTDDTAELCLAGEEWTVETDIGPERELLTVRVVEVT